MKKILGALVAALAMLVIAVPSGQAQPYADIGVSFSDDFLSATITSSKGISHYDVVLCDKTLGREEIGVETHSLDVGPFDAQIVSITVKSGRSVETVFSGYAGECKKPDPDPK